MTLDVAAPDWKQVDAWSEELHALLRVATDNVLDGVISSRQSTIQAAANDAQPPSEDVGFDLSSIELSWTTQIDDLIVPFVSGIIDEAAALVQLGVTEAQPGILVPDLPFDYHDRYIENMTSRISGYGDYLYQQVRDTIAEGVEADETIEQLTARVHAVSEVTDARAGLIARTESAAASNSSALAQAEATGLAGRKRWLATEDSRTRLTHMEANGQTVPLGESFRVGGSPLQYCGDVDGPPGETIQCRCTLLFEFDEIGLENLVATTGAEQGAAGMGMIALVPDAESAARIVQVGGEPIEELHLTLEFLGDVSGWSQSTAQRVITSITEVSLGQAAITVTGFGISLWNPQSDNPCVVMNFGGAALKQARDAICSALHDVWASTSVEQHDPWLPHVTLAYTADPGAVDGAADVVGPVTFDRIRVALAGQVTDIPLMNDGMMLVAAIDTDDDTDEDVQDVTTGEDDDTEQTYDSTVTNDGRFEGILAVEGKPTGDGRQFAPGSLTWDQLPVSLLWTPASFGQHLGAVVTGRIDSIYRDTMDPSVIRFGGQVDLDGPDGMEMARQIRGRYLKGVSVDLDDIKESDVEYVMPEVNESSDDMFMMGPELTIFHSGRIRAATVVAMPAFVEAQLWMTDGSMEMNTVPEPSEVVNASVVFHTKPHKTFVSHSPWNAMATMRDVPESLSVGVAYQLFGWVDRSKVSLGAVPAAACRFIHHEVVDGRVGAANVQACSTIIGQLLSDSSLKLSLTEREGVYKHLAAHLSDAGLTPQPFDSSAFSTDVKAVTACGCEDKWAPPAEWFADPQLNGDGGSISVTADGRIYGYAAKFGTCHVGMQSCTTAPFERSHDFFMLGEVLTAGGESLSVGTITMGTGHAPTYGVDAKQAAEHYDDTGSAVAYVRVGNDKFGIWVAGAVRPGTPEARIADLRAAKLSGDWRRIGGQLRLVALLAVNVPGFPVPRTSARVDRGQALSLVAAGIPRGEPEVEAPAELTASGRMKERLAKRLGRDLESRRAALGNRMGKE